MTKRICAFFAAALLLAAILGGCALEKREYHGTTAPVTDPNPTKPSQPEKETLPEETGPQPTVYTLTFAGDCTLGTDPEVYGAAGTFVYVVGDNYDYPFEKVLPHFANDDFTMVNFEGVLAEEGEGKDKEYRFRGPLAYAKILTAGSVELVNLANNHSRDFGDEGYNSTKTALEAEGVPYVEHDRTTLYTTETGLKIGVFAAQFWVSIDHMENSIAKLREEGAEIVIVSYHGGTEGSYHPTPDQQTYAHAAIDAGADIFFGHHPHVLQPIEEYNGGVIYYSLGNFAFGGNRNPKDKDTAIIRQQVIRELDGTIRLGETKAIPYCLSSATDRNTYQPTPYALGSEEYLRAMSKLEGTFAGPDLVTTPTTPTTPPATTQPPTQPTETPTQPTETPTQPSESTPVETEPVTPPADTETE